MRGETQERSSVFYAFQEQASRVPCLQDEGAHPHNPCKKKAPDIIGVEYILYSTLIRLKIAAVCKRKETVKQHFELISS